MYKLVYNSLSIIDKDDLKELVIYLSKNNINIFSSNITFFEKEVLRLLVVIFKYNLIIGNNNKVLFSDREELIHTLVNKYLNYKKNIDRLIKYYHVEQIVDFSLTKNNIYYNELYDIYLNHISYINVLPKYKSTINIDGKKCIVSIGFVENSNETHNLSSALSMSFLYEGEYIFNISIYLGINEIFISNIHYYKSFYLNFSERSALLHRIGLLFVYKISLNLNKDNIIGYSNINHCCKYHKGFLGKYDEYLSSFGFSLNNENYYLLDNKNFNIKKKYDKKYNFIDTYLGMIKIIK